MIDSIMSEEWVEMLAEDELCSAKLSRNVMAFPMKLQREIMMMGKKEFNNRLAEQIYYDLINEFAASRWLTNLVRFILNRETLSELSDVMVIDRSSHRKRFTMLSSLDYKRGF
jgi:hypothetical protein